MTPPRSTRSVGQPARPSLRPSFRRAGQARSLPAAAHQTLHPPTNPCRPLPHRLTPWRRSQRAPEMTSFTVASILEKTTNRRAHPAWHTSRRRHAPGRAAAAARAASQLRGLPASEPGKLFSTSPALRRDKDFRYMATSDLLAELSKETFKPDSDGERKICKCVLKLLNDQSSDVQGLAVKWCVPSPPAKAHRAGVVCLADRRPACRRAAFRRSCARCTSSRWRRSWCSW